MKTCLSYQCCHVIIIIIIIRDVDINWPTQWDRPALFFRNAA